MKCSQCDAGFPLYRNNPKGEKADWRCEAHLDTPLEEDTQGLVNDLQDAVQKLGDGD